MRAPYRLVVVDGDGAEVWTGRQWQALGNVRRDTGTVQAWLYDEYKTAPAEPCGDEGPALVKALKKRWGCDE